MLLASSLLALVPLQTLTVSIPATGDATLIESPDGGTANGQGPHLFVGRTGQPANGIRRGLVRFDVAGHVPAKALIESVSLTLNVSQTNAGPVDVSVHRLLAAWGEGPSSSNGGQGAPASAGDATWIHRSYPDEYWVKPGGHFVAAASAGATVAGPGFYLWEDTPLLVNDVRLWSRVPNRNFGWALVADESTPATAKRFDSREHPSPAVRPVLVVSYRLPPKKPRAP